jgi:co-chaperonin GroES (HSP10)
MAKMVSLQMSKQEAKKDMGLARPSKEAADLPRYPYGTTLRLDTETLKKLGIDLADYPLDAECDIVAKGTVVDVSQSQRQGGEPRKSLEIQITDMSISESASSKKKKAEDEHLNAISGSAAEEGDEY